MTDVLTMDTIFAFFKTRQVICHTRIMHRRVFQSYMMGKERNAQRYCFELLIMHTVCTNTQLQNKYHLHLVQ